jgi:hypothetical protein
MDELEISKSKSGDLKMDGLSARGGSSNLRSPLLDFELSDRPISNSSSPSCQASMLLWGLAPFW